MALIPRAGRAEVHVREQCNIHRREVLAGTGEVDPQAVMGVDVLMQCNSHFTAAGER